MARNKTMTEFQKRWHETRERQGSNIVAGLDPALYEVGKGQYGLDEGVDLKEWSLRFIDAVAPYVAMIKTNQAFFQGVGQTAILKELVDRIHEHGLLALSDNKVSDIGNTNEAYFYYNHSLGFDAVTCAPYAGNIESSIELARKNNISIMTMGLMSNPEYQSEMYFTDPETGETLWHSRVRRSVEAGADAVVVGGTYTKKDAAFVEFVELTKSSDILYLIPGIGTQGGEVTEFLASGIDATRCMISSSRGMMFPNGSGSTPEEQAEAAKILRDQCNDAIK